jgi:SMC interacting uncharacterized protein involved in chromosome segregation
MTPLAIPLIFSLTLIAVVCVIAFSCMGFYTSDSKRALTNAEEKYTNLDNLMRQKDSEHERILKHMEEEGKRMADIIKSLMEKQSRLSVDADIRNK